MPTPPPAADPGLFGPGSITWRVGHEPAGFVAGLRALLQRSLHPDTVAGFDALSDYRRNPWPRLTRTAEYVAVTPYGTVGQAQRAAAGVEPLTPARLGWTTVAGLAVGSLPPWARLGLESRGRAS
ncbi:MAG: oxygenase MpaB family protein [Kineosporiaceae bacterium]